MFEVVPEEPSVSFESEKPPSQSTATLSERSACRSRHVNVRLLPTPPKNFRPRRSAHCARPTPFAPTRLIFGTRSAESFDAWVRSLALLFKVRATNKL